jgi:hypothetical protein
MTELGISLYQSLRSALSFRYALVGVEVDELKTYSELIEESSNLSISGLGLAKPIERELGILPVLCPFSPSYVWQPYAGQVYNLLMTSPNLKNKLNEMLSVSLPYKQRRNNNALERTVERYSCGLQGYLLPLISAVNYRRSSYTL